MLSMEERWQLEVVVRWIVLSELLQRIICTAHAICARWCSYGKETANQASTEGPVGGLSPCSSFALSALTCT